MTEIAEDILQLGPEDGVVGLLSRPQKAATAGPRGSAMICLNAGVLHRVGPHRLHVELGRKLAAEGIPALRLDLSGIGDSRFGDSRDLGKMSFRDSAVADARAAMDRLGQRADRFVLFGLCSGADNALATAGADERVAAIVLVDPYSYATRRAQVRHLMTRVSSMPSPIDAVGWAARVALREAKRRVARASDAARSGDHPDHDTQTYQQGREVPPLHVFGDQLTAVIDRGVRVLAIYSGSHGATYNHRDQLFEWFPHLRGRLDCRYHAKSNHTFTELRARRRLLDEVVAWTRSVRAR